MSKPVFDPRLSRPEHPVVRATDVACIVFDRTNLDDVVRFMEDFGFSRVERTEAKAMFYAKGGFGPAYIAHKSDKNSFRGIGLYVPEREDLEKLSRLDGASSIEAADGYPGAYQVRLTDPAGNIVLAINGPKSDMPAIRRSLRQNLDDDRSRVNEGQRPPKRPSTILRLGHLVLTSVDFFKVARWYMDTFGLLPSDVQTFDDGDPALVFLRCDCGDTPVDHHTVVVAQYIENGVGHSAYEVIDLDDIAMGQEHLQSKGWKHAWGVGRHELGSQIFDYWRDPVGIKMEHFCDSDRFTSSQSPGVSELTISSLYQWGPPTPRDFDAPKPSVGMIYRTLKNLRSSEDLTFKRLRKLLSVAGQKPRPWVKKH